MVVEIRPQPGPQEAFLGTSADIGIYGGMAFGGKTWALLLEPLRHIDNPEFGAVAFRRTSPQITNKGGLWDEASKLYPLVGGKPYESNPKQYRFPSGSSIAFHHLQHEKNKYDWQGSQIPLICFDELTHFSEGTFFYMLSRNRSTCGVRPYVRATVNPDADSWVAEFISWWIDPETGLAISERCGVLRWFVRVNDQLIWADSPEELEAMHPGIPPKSVTFIAASIFDNVLGLAADPGYLANLHALPLVERERLLGGNWKIRHAAGNVFKRHWFEAIDVCPPVVKWVRWWDLAATAGGGDFSCGVKMGITADEMIIIADVRRGQYAPDERDRMIIETAKEDGPTVTIGIEVEPGSAGIAQYNALLRKLIGYTVTPSKPTGSKVVRAGPFSSFAGAGRVKLLKGKWNEPFKEELAAFPDGSHDDQVDPSSAGFKHLTRKTTKTTVR